jgi:hypothetical protein
MREREINIERKGKTEAERERKGDKEWKREIERKDTWRDGSGIPTHFCLKKLSLGALLCGILTPLSIFSQRERERENVNLLGIIVILYGATTFSITTLSKTALGKTLLSITTSGNMTLSITNT